MNTECGQAGYSSKGASAYARVGVETQVLSASSHGLIEMLFDGLIMNIRKARLHMSNGHMPAKGMAIARALDILNQGLLASLDRENGGQIAENLALLYDYCARLLLSASVENSIEKLDEAAELLQDIGTAWREIGRKEIPGRQEEQLV